MDTQRIDPVIDEFSTFALEDASDNRILRSSLWVAFAAHLVLLLINFPSFDGETRAAPEKKERVYVLKNEKWKPPEVPKTPIRPQEVKIVPVPDETPDEPEPLRLDQPRRELDLPPVDTDYFVIPKAPPAPPEPDHPLPVGGDVSRPEKIYATQPSYTEIARKARIQGTVIVQAIIDKRGEVTNVEVLKGLPMGLTESAVDAIKTWKFKPATLGGKPVDVYYNLTVTFKLQ
jgi:periplasmic protein TonB